MSMSFACLCVTLLICGYYCTATVSSHCPDYNNFDVCEDDELDRLQVSFGGCDAKVTRNEASDEPVVKYDKADPVLPLVLLLLLLLPFI